MLLSVVIPVFNEGGAIHLHLAVILEHLKQIRGIDFNLLIVDDGSTDNTVDQVKEICCREKEVALLCLNRNFGKEAAVHAGLRNSSGDAVLVMDSDLQHPPQLISEMIELWRAGAMVVDACKSSRGKEDLSTKLLSKGFYAVFQYLTKIEIKDKSDFKLLDRKVVDAYCNLSERNRFFRGMIPWMGFSTAQVYFDVPKRPHGQTSWSRFRLFKFALMAMTNFTSAPLHLVNFLSGIFFVSALMVGGIALYDKFVGTAAGGFPTVILLILISGSFIMFSLGQIGIYIEQIFDEIKQRPHFLVDEEKSRLKGHLSDATDDITRTP
ncbi:MAG: glycosyltransferase family 2 protein [Desulfobacterium sp.]|jgi:dolichol-phosphate mannosyltransferase|nr:glycosyltransferase family 2 protein [Desulfobacterium sp.]